MSSFYSRHLCRATLDLKDCVDKGQAKPIHPLPPREASEPPVPFLLGDTGSTKPSP